MYAEVPGEPGFRAVKLLSEDPANYPDASREGIRRILEDINGELMGDGDIDASGIDWIRMGTTVATNALLERKGDCCALLITSGFGDILQIGNQNRPNIFDLEIKKPDLLYEDVIEVKERIRPLKSHETLPGVKIVEGITNERFAVIQPLDIESVLPQLQRIYNKGIRSLAVVLMHAYAWPDHEQAIGRVAKGMGFTQVSLSSEVMPRVKLVARGDTTMVDAYLNPHIKSYLDSFRKGFKHNLENTRLLFMQSDGGLAPADAFTGSRAILSGPAGGVVGFAKTTWDHSNGKPVIGFDMGGTSTDVSRFDGDYELIFETETAGVRIQAPQLNIKTVAAGGGSRLFFENQMFMVGPESAGAHPGPVCYRKGGHLAVTDANLVLGRIQPAYFPHIFGPSEDLPLDVEGSRRAMAKMAAKINAHNRSNGLPELSTEQVALGFIQVANETMVRAIREISVMRGFDSKAHVLATFGGAGPQHACAIARSLGISEVFIHRFAGILSAYGMGLADVVVERQKPASMMYDQSAFNTKQSVTPAKAGVHNAPDNMDFRLRGNDVKPENNAFFQKIEHEFKDLETQACDELFAQGFKREDVEVNCYLNLRYEGTDTAMMVPRPEDNDFAKVMRETYKREFGFDLSDRNLFVDDIRVRAVGKSAALGQMPITGADTPPVPLETVDGYFEEGRLPVKVYDLNKLRAGHRVTGPAIIIQDTTTILVELDCHADITQYGDVAIHIPKRGAVSVGTQADPIQLSIFSSLFMSIAEQMGRMLQKTAISTNIKERLDFSCALFGPQGELVANAPHVPVHLGAMSEAVKAQIRLRQNDIHPGDVLVSNHPAAGGSHLPDITVITPVFENHEIIFWVASRGHHADIGGISPGSMPPYSIRLEEEGACIDSFKLVKNGRFQETGIRDLLAAPEKIKAEPGRPDIKGTRRMADNLSDLKAQVAANQKGIELVKEMVEQYGLEVVQAYMGHVRNAAEAAVRERLKDLSLANRMAEKDSVKAVDYLDDGSPIALALIIDRKDGSAIFDFSGTGPEVKGNCNAPKAVTTSAVLYCLRCLIKKELPLNHGCLIPIEIKIPAGSLLDPSPNAAVVGGNVLTSQRVVDVVLKAFHVAAASQGCMNNFTFGNDQFGYYETIGGGAGAGPTWNGQSGVHTHMTNTRITDPEILESRYPILLKEFALRRGSGGSGLFQGGDGLVREVEFLEPLSAAILSERRVYAPYGLDGGAPGEKGENLFIKEDGEVINLGGKGEVKAGPGDRIRIMTPGGGGYGKK